MQEKGDYNMFTGDYKCIYKIKHFIYYFIYLLGMECVCMHIYMHICKTKQKQCLQGNTQLFGLQHWWIISERKKD